MAAMTSTGTTLSVSASTPGTEDQAGYEALSFTAVGEMTDLPEFGPNAQVVTHEPLQTGITEKFKGFINYGSVAIGLAYDSTDAGQIILSEAVDGSTYLDRHSFKVTFPDGSVKYFGAKVFSYTTNPGSANSMVGSSVQVEIETAVVDVAAP